MSKGLLAVLVFDWNLKNFSSREHGYVNKRLQITVKYETVELLSQLQAFEITYNIFGWFFFFSTATLMPLRVVLFE